MSTVKRIVNILLSFILAVLLTVLTLAGTLQFTLLNENFILDNMNTCNYITEKKDEITSSLTDLGYASGLEEDFFSDLLNEVMLHDDVEKYLSDYYSGKGSVIDKTAFKQTFNTALDKYIEKKGIDPNSVSSDNREYLIKEAAKIYKQSLELPFFGKLAGRFQNLKTIVPYVMAVCLILSILIIVIFILSTKRKHRAARYICYATSATFLSTAVLPLIILLSKKVETFNIASRATYMLFVSCANNMLVCILSCSAFFLIVSAAMFLLYKKLYKKALK